MNRRLITAFDIALIAILLTCLLGFWFIRLGNGGNTAVVSVNNAEVARLALSKDGEQIFKTVDGFNKLIVKNGKCSVVEADCRDGICINRGEISKVGESIVCLPHKFIVEIE